MANMSKYSEDANLAWLKGTAFPAPPTAVYLGMNFGDPTDAGGGGTEVTTSLRSAGRIAVTFGTTTSPTVDAEQIANSAASDFGNAAAATIYSRFMLFDAATGGNLLRSALVTGVVTTTTTAASSSSTSLSVTSATGITAGQFVAGTGITSGTTVSSISGTTVTLSQAATVANGVFVDFGAISVSAGTDVQFPVGALVDMIA